MKSLIYQGIATVLIILVLGMVIWFEAIPWLQIIRMILGSIMVLFIPGYWLTWIFFPEKRQDKNKKDGIDSLERFALSIALSLSVTPLVLFYVNFLGMRITLWNIYAITLCVTFVGMILGLYRAHNAK